VPANAASDPVATASKLEAENGKRNIEAEDNCDNTRGINIKQRCEQKKSCQKNPQTMIQIPQNNEPKSS
jgi:hypothetical protein